MASEKYGGPEWIGKRYGHLVIGEYDIKQRKFRMLCDCGGETYAKPTLLFRGKYKTCGIQCPHHQEGYDRRSRDRLYPVWHGMVDRCTNPKNMAYRTYGARGIRVCGEWALDFWSFRDWAMSNGYEEGLTIERIDNDGNYSPQNCKFIPLKEQSKNRHEPYTFMKRPGMVLIDGEERTKKAWCEIYGISVATARYRMKTHGVSFEEAVKMGKRANKRF